MNEVFLLFHEIVIISKLEAGSLPKSHPTSPGTALTRPGPSRPWPWPMALPSPLRTPLTRAEPALGTPDHLAHTDHSSENLASELPLWVA